MSNILISPFKHRSADIKCLNDKSSISYRDFTRLQNKGIIKVEHIYILDLLLKYKYLTKFMIKNLIDSDNEIKHKYENIKVSKLLTTLFRNGVILKKYLFWYKEVNENKVISGTPNIYSLSRGGLAYLVKVNRLKLCIDDYMINSPIQELYKILAVNQLISNYKLKVKLLRKIETNFNTNSFKHNVKFNIYSLLYLRYDKQDINLIIEPVRRCSNWQNTLNKRLNLLSDFIIENTNNDCMPQFLVILLCEDDNHIKETYVNIAGNYPVLFILFTTDVRQMEEKLSSSLISVKNKDKKLCLFEHRVDFLA